MRTVQVKLTSADGKESLGTVSIQSIPVATRIQKAVGVMGIWTIIASASIAIPIVHFVSVPLFLLCGIIHSLAKYRTAEIIVHGDAVCAVCNAAFNIEPTRASWPIDDVCTACKRHLSIQPIEI